MGKQDCEKAFTGKGRYPAPYSIAASIIIIAFLLLGAACATQTAYQNYRGEDAACVKGHSPNIIEFMASTGTTGVESVDGVSTQGVNMTYTGSICMPPGLHTVTIGVHSGRFLSAHEEFSLDFTSRGRYIAKSKVGGRSSTIKLFEIHGDQEVEVQSHRTQTERAPLF